MVGQTLVSSARILALSPDEKPRVKRAVQEFLRRYKRPLLVRNGRLVLSPVRAAPTKPPHQPPASVRYDELEGMCRADPDLNRLERYAHRAAARRNRALREFIFIKSLREFQLRSERTQERDGRQDGAHAGTQ